MNIKKVKLVIWDLDETFWKGTLSEGGVEKILDNIDIVKRLVDRGIMNSIVSKNDKEKVEFVLKDWELWDLFVFPKISWQPKGKVVASLLKEMGLRAENTLFVDDNISNLKEVEFYNKGISCILPTELSGIMSHPAFEGKNDKEHSRLKQYHVLEKRSEAQQEYKSNEEFLRSSNITIQLCNDCLAEEERIYELIQRTNQLNYTKVRSSRKELHQILADNTYLTQYVIVKDNFGNYGITGFLALKNNRLIHFLFSCRTIGFGVENFIYKRMGCPELSIVGDVATPLDPTKEIDWITVSSVKLKDYSNNTVDGLKVLMVAGCDLEQAASYLNKQFTLDTEFATVVNGNLIKTSDTCSLVNTLNLDDKIKRELSDNLPFIDNEHTFGTKLFSGKYDVIFISVVDDYIRGIYSHKSGSFCVGFGSFYDQSEVFERYPKANWDYLNENFVFVGKETTEVFEQNLRTIIHHIPKTTSVLLLNGIDLDVSEWIGRERIDRNLEMNEVVDKIVADYENVSLIDMRKIVTNKDMLVKNVYGQRDNRHFDRKVYYEMAKSIADECNRHSKTKITLLNPQIARIKMQIKRYVNCIERLRLIIRKKRNE